MERPQPVNALITSASNAHIKWLRSLRERRGREAAGAFIVEGPRAVGQALTAGAVPLRLAYTPELAATGLLDEDPFRRLPPSANCLQVHERVLGSITDTRTTQGLLAAFPLLTWTPALAGLSHPLLLLLDRISDPGNLGTLLRSAAAAGADAVLLSEGCADPHNPKVVRATAGALFNIGFATLPWSRIGDLLAPLRPVYAADAEAPRVHYEADFSGACAILVGNEAGGLGPEALALATDRVRIPMTNGVESLNAGVAGSLLLYEAVRQRAYREGGVADVAGG